MFVSFIFRRISEYAAKYKETNKNQLLPAENSNSKTNSNIISTFINNGFARSSSNNQQSNSTGKNKFFQLETFTNKLYGFKK